jgi:hypothetical protein
MTAGDLVIPVDWQVPTRQQIDRMTDEQLQAASDRLERYLDSPECRLDDELESHVMAMSLLVEREQDNRDDWNSDDDRIREAVGNFHPTDARDAAPYDVMQVER